MSSTSSSASSKKVYDPKGLRFLLSVIDPEEEDEEMRVMKRTHSLAWGRGAAADEWGSLWPDEDEESELRDAKPQVFPKHSTIRGLLDVRVSHSRKWSTRYFVLKNNVLIYAQSALAESIQSVIFLESTSVRPLVADSTVDSALLSSDEEMDTPQTTDQRLESDTPVLKTGAISHAKSVDYESDLDLERIFELTIRKGKAVKTIEFRAEDGAKCKQWVAAMRKAAVLKLKDIYTLRRKLGAETSQSSKVLSAKHIETGEECAIKVLDKRRCDIVALHSELQILKTMSGHRNVVAMLELFETSKYLYICMQLCKGGELFDAICNLADGFYDESDALAIMHQIASAVHYMHERGVVHRDLKPENVLCVNEGSIEYLKVADFGISKLTQTQTQTQKPKIMADARDTLSPLPSERSTAALFEKCTTSPKRLTAPKPKFLRLDSTGIAEHLMGHLKDGVHSPKRDAAAVVDDCDADDDEYEEYESKRLTEEISRVHYLGSIPEAKKGGGSVVLESLRVSATESPTTTTMKTMVGTMTYTAPEILFGCKYDSAVDCWSLGVIMYILLVGYPPFYDESEVRLRSEIVNTEVAYESEDWNEVSASVRELVSGLLQKDARKRKGTEDILKVTGALHTGEYQRGVSLLGASQLTKRASTFRNAHCKLRDTLRRTQRKSILAVTGKKGMEWSSSFSPY